MACKGKYGFFRGFWRKTRSVSGKGVCKNTHTKAMHSESLVIFVSLKIGLTMRNFDKPPERIGEMFSITQVSLTHR